MPSSRCITTTTETFPYLACNTDTVNIYCIIIIIIITSEDSSSSQNDLGRYNTVKCFLSGHSRLTWLSVMPEMSTTFPAATKLL